MTRRNVAALLALVSLAACLPESVQSVTLSPATPELAAALAAADARWEAAGVDPDRIIIAPVGSAEGSPVTLNPELAPASITRVLGKGRAFAGVEWMQLSSLDHDISTHEIGHALGIYGIDGGHATGPDCAAESAARPVMCSHVHHAVLSDADLALACEAGACVGYSPER
jgi:hypothetical protein